jgi:PAS domain S-box-containing protein
METLVRYAGHAALATLVANAAVNTDSQAFAGRCRQVLIDTLGCDEVELTLSDVPGPPPSAASSPAESLASESLHLRQADRDALSAAWADEASQTSGIVALLAGPEAPLGTLAVRFAEIRTFTDDERAFVGAVAALQSTVVQRERFEQAHLRVASHMRELADLLPMFIWVATTDGQLAFFNQRLLDFTGRSLEEQVAGGWEAAIHPDDVKPFLTMLRGAIAEQAEFEAEVRICDARGGFGWFLHRGVPAFDDDGGLNGYIGSSTNITDSRRAIDALRAIADIGAELSPSLDQDDIAAVLARFMVSRGLGVVAMVALRGPDGGFRCTCSTGTFDEEIVAKFVQASADNMPGNAAARAVGLAGPAVLAPPLAASEESALRELGLGSVVGVPLPARGRVVGAIILLFPGSEDVLTLNTGLAYELAGRAALAIDNAGLYAESQRQGNLLQRSNDALQFLANTGIELTRIVQDDQTMQRVAELAVPAFADVAIIDVIGEDGVANRVGVAASSERLRKLVRAIRPPQSFSGGMSRELHDGHSVMISQVRARHTRLFAQYVGDTRRLSDIAPGSALFIPMTARGQVLGLITFIRVQGRLGFTSGDLFAVADQLGRRSGLSVDNARLFAESRAREAELQRANVAKDEFLGLMSHELRTPITVINGGARILKNRGETLSAAARAEIVADVSHEAGRLAAMLEDMLALARIELNKRPALEPVLLHRLIDRLAADALPLRRVVHLSIGSDLPAAAGEPSYIDHVFRNMMSNADKYSPADAAIDVVVTDEDGWIAVRVLDRGPGIPAEETERIFERFYRAEHTSRLASGAGMGLAVCKRLVTAMAGEIWACPREGGGLEVGFRLPLYTEEEL